VEKIKLSVSLILVISLVSIGSFCLSAQDDVVNIKYWNLFTGGDGAWMSQIVEEFNEAHPSIKVEELTIEWANYYPKLTTALVGKKGPDVAICHYSRLAKFVPRGVFYPIGEVAKSVGVDLDDYNPMVLDAGKFEGEQYELPLDTHPEILYYNPDILKAAGLTDENGEVMIPEGKEEFLEFSRKIKEKTDAWALSIEIVDNAYTPVRILHGLVKGQGGNYLNKDKTASALDGPALNVLKFYDQLFNEDKVAPNDVNYEESVSLFSEGRAAFHINGVWATGTFEQTEDLNFGAVPLPRIFDEQATWTDSHTFVFPKQQKKDEEKLEAAVTFASWAAKEGFQVWAKAGHIPVRDSVLESEWYNNMKYRPDYAAALNTVHYVPFTPDWLEVEDASMDIVASLNTGQIGPEEALEKLEKEINSIL